MSHPSIRAGLSGLVLLLSSCALTQVAPNVTAPEASELSAARKKPAGWRDDFSGTELSSAWTRSSWPGFWQRDGLQGSWDPTHAWVSRGALVLKLSVTPDGAGYQARGAEVARTAPSGYGRYEYRLRAASGSADPLAAAPSAGGTISAAFSYAPNAVSEIDLELEGRTPEALTAGSWASERHDWASIPLGQNLGASWHTYAYEWRPDSLKFFVDGQLKWSSSVVPSQSATVMFNVWPTNDAGWGGLAETGERFMLVDWVSFTPL